MKNTLYIYLVSIFLTSTQLFAQYENAISNQVIVRMQKELEPHIMLKQAPSYLDLKIETILSEHADIWLLNFNDSQTHLAEVLRILNRYSSVLYAQPNRKIEFRATPNDPLFNSQWHHDNIQSELAWDITTGGSTAKGREIVVALIESADLMNHNDLKDNHWVNTNEIPNNGIDDDGNGYIDDYNGWNVYTNNDDIGSGAHGTACAGMMGAKGNNDTGVTGINWDLKIMDIAGYTNPFTEANIIASYNYALNARLIWNQTNGAKGAFVVATSSSWGVDGGNPADYPIWCSFYDDLGQAGILNVGATTNLNQDVDVFGDMPTACASDYMIGVTATNYLDEIDFAGYGRQTIDLAAPGSFVYSTGPNNTYISKSGASFACPLTAGVIGLMYSIPCSNLEELAIIDPSGAADLVKQALFDGVDRSPHLQERTITGGRVNAKNALDKLMNATCNICMPPNVISTKTVNDYDASIIFSQTGINNEYQINIKVTGSNNWSNYSTNDTVYTFTELTNCTTYEYYISSICDGEIGYSSRIQTFRTNGCGNCIDFEYCETGANIDSPASFTVHSPASISGSYNFQSTNNWGGKVENSYVFGELVLVDDGSSSPFEGCNNLVNSSVVNGNIAVIETGGCDFTVKAMNAQNAGATAVVIINNGPGTIEMEGSNNNITIPAIMISQADGDILMTSINNNDQPQALLGKQNEWIEEFKIDGNIFTSGDNGGYYFNDNSLILNIGQNYSFTLTPGIDGPALEEYSRIWLDLNQDTVFTSSELIYDQGSASLGAVNGNFTIPTNAKLGSTRMRVQMAYQGYGASTLPDVCGDFTFGEVEDYCIEIKTATPCNMTVSSTVTHPTCNELKNGSINLDVSGGSPGYAYTWNNGMNSASINNLNTNNYSVIITDASDCDTTVNYSLNYARQLTLSKTVTPPTCPKASDGSISVYASGGNNFNYQWNNGPNSNTWSNIEAGNYQVTATDDEGCKITTSYKVVDPIVDVPFINFTTDHYYLKVEFNNETLNAQSYHWDFNDGNSSMDINPTHTYTNEGVFNVCLTANSDCDTITKCKSIIVEKEVGLKKDEVISEVKVYPNPASSTITIEKQNSNISKAIVYAANGKLIKKVDLLSSSTKLSTRSWNSGIYYIHFTDKKEIILLTKRLSILN